ncbi:MAG: hypothetical protein B7Y43_12865 [Sphingomonas sp. 28-62-20]|uniref:DUF4893 domain-containing protein n=1 Tax=Sphingomonas sp. 28-62-20 TaxID=1970433 RepID=UPI000BD8D810|nr:MAG: hypothetical protein B7Y43_12865 [Sphingomonas sp. 28-62-20]
MMTAKFLSTIVLMAALAACGGHSARVEAGVPVATANWRAVATQPDRERLRDWRDAWMAALDRIRGSDAAELAAQGALFDPDHALLDGVPPAGDYRCRVFKLGGNGTAMAEFTRYPDDRCRIETNGGVSKFYKITGTQRQSGTIYPDSPSRAVFLGTLSLADEKRAMDYDRDDVRNLAGYFERVGEKRWRLVLPRPQFESILDVIELVPLQ